MKKIFLLFFFLLQIIFVFAQQTKIDSLKIKLQDSKSDSEYVRTLFDMANEYYLSKPDTIFIISESALSISRKNNYKRGIAEAYVWEAYLYEQKGDIQKALNYFHLSLKLWEEINDKYGIGNCLNNLASIYDSQGEMSKAMDYYKQSYKILNEIGEKEGSAYALNNIGYSYNSLKDTANALKFYIQSLIIREEIKDSLGMGQSLYNIGSVYDNSGNINKALDYYNKSLKIRESINDKQGLTYPLNSIGKIYLKQKNINASFEYANRSLKLSEEIGFSENIRNAEELLSKIYFARNDFKNALVHYQKYILFRDSTSNEKNRKATFKQQVKYEYEKKEAILKEQQEKERVVAEEKSRKQKIITWSVIGGLLFVIVFAGFIFRSLRITRKQKQIIEVQKTEVEKAKHIIEEKNKDITDSINYAKRIQKAMLPHRRDIWAAFTQSFVLFKPKDIVSGDFYFFQAHPRPLPLGGENEKQQVLPNGEDLGGALFFIASADCTGHGVPGAFMSMIGSDKLEDAVSQSADTSEILSLLNKGIKTALKQSDSNESTRDGMDIALCSVDTNARVVKYAGANRPIWIIRKTPLSPNSPPYQGGDKGMVLEEIKATKKAIGGFTEDNQHFDTHVIKLQQGDTFYISTDGYADTFGKNGKKLMTKTFKEILLSIQDKTMKEQEQHLDNFIEDWKGGTEQVDDILVIGVRL